MVRVGLYGDLLAKKLEKHDSFVDTIRIQAVLHDVGKIHLQIAAMVRKYFQTTIAGSVQKGIEE